MSSLSLLLVALLSLLSLTSVTAQVSSGYCFSYTLTGGDSAATQWIITASGLIATSNPLSTAIRNQANITGITGTRTFYNASFTSTVSFTGVTSGSTSSNVVYSQYPYTDFSGWQLSASGPVYYETGVGDNSIYLLWAFSALVELSGTQDAIVGHLKVIAQATVSSVASCPANVTLPVYSLQQYSFCWYIQSDGSDAVSAAGFPWTTYAYGVFTASQPLEQQGRQAMQINSITGIRYFAINGSTWYNRLTGVKNVLQDEDQYFVANDNMVYLSAPYLDDFGWLVTADNNLTYPTGQSTSPDIEFGFSTFALEYVDQNADAYNYVQSTNQGFAFSAYTAGGSHAPCKSHNNTATALTPSTTQWTFCYSIYGADVTNGAWQITSSGTITTYAQPVNTTNVNDSYPAYRPGYVVVGVSGTRVWSNATVTSSRNILGMVPDTQVFSATYPADNVIYTSYPYVDAGGLSFYLDGPVFPQLVDAYGQVLNNVSFVNIHTNGVNPLKELPTGAEAGSLIIRPAASNANLPAQCAPLVAGTTSHYQFCYFITGDKSVNDPAPTASWTVSAWGVITVTGPFEREGVANTYRVTGIQGQRAVGVTTAAGVTTNITQNIAGIKAPDADITTYYTLTNNILYPTGIPAIGAIPGSSSILVDVYGWLLTLDGNVSYPSANGTVKSAGPDLNILTDQFASNQYQETSVYDTVPIFLQSAVSGMSVKAYSGGAVSFSCPNTPASFTPGSQSDSSSGGSGLSGGAIAGIVIGSLVGALLLCLIVALLLGRSSRVGKGDAKRLGGGHGSADTDDSSQVQHDHVELQS